ncbi:fused signal recognition particle receptor [Bacilli bacterium PM5-3]|nr:fused signal recognition particle receptor [Bacilli bacterium PM5-3]MDH6602928.1 fused signal recognition particle receptor [Bacilli bacterium PM5-9]
MASFFKKISEAVLGKSAQSNDKYVAGLDKSRKSFTDHINDLAARYREIDEDYFEELENALIMADVGVNMVMNIVDEIRKEVRLQNITNPKEINDLIVDKMFVIYANQGYMSTKLNVDNPGLNVILMVGVNGVGKTTTISKLTNQLKKDGKKVMLAAGDTFRAGAINQLDEWAKRLDVMIAKKEENSDPSAVIYEAIQTAKENDVDVLICDTAGRLQNKVNLMNELDKIKRVIQKEVPDGPQETLLVIDATTGQNGVAQASIFKEVADVTGIILSKMDGSAKGGIVLAIKELIDIPVKYITVGEQIDDIEEFDLEEYIYSLCKDLFNE